MSRPRSIAKRAHRAGAAQLSRVEFARWLRGRVASRAPAAVIRLGDGEVRLLKADPSDADSMRAANRQLAKQSSHALSAEAVLDVRAALRRAGAEAEVLGIVGRDLVTDAGGIWSAHLADLCAERTAAGKPPLALASCRLNHDILAELPRLLAGRRISAITCRDVKPVIEARWRVTDVAVYRVPSQARTREVDGAYEAALHEAPIWPDAHDLVRSELTVRERGEVFLVGAGVFGKDLCIDVRDRGGIALDMGSALDHVAGKVTRAPMAMAIELHANGASIPQIAANLSDRFGERIPDRKIKEFVDAVSPYFR